MERIVIAVEGFGTAEKISDKFVDEKSRLAAVVADLINPGDWHYHYQEGGVFGVPYNDALKMAKLKIPRGDGVCYHTIILVGFSLGGDVVYSVARELNKAGIAVDLVLTLDPVSRVTPGSKIILHYSKLPNVSRWINYYEREGLYILRGSSVENADIDRKITTTANKAEWITVFPGVRKANEPDKWEYQPVQGLKEMMGGALSTGPHTSIPVLAEVLQEFRASVQKVPQFRDSNSVPPAKYPQICSAAVAVQDALRPTLASREPWPWRALF
jgi:hypothetical protein